MNGAAQGADCGEARPPHTGASLADSGQLKGSLPQVQDHPLQAAACRTACWHQTGQSPPYEAAGLSGIDIEHCLQGSVLQGKPHTAAMTAQRAAGSVACAAQGKQIDCCWHRSIDQMFHFMRQPTRGPLPATLLLTCMEPLHCQCRAGPRPADGYCLDGCCLLLKKYLKVQCMWVLLCPWLTSCIQASAPAPPHLADGCWAERLTDGLPDAAPLLRVGRCQDAVVLGSSLQRPRGCQLSGHAQQPQVGRSVGQVCTALQACTSGCLGVQCSIACGCTSKSWQTWGDQPGTSALPPGA